MRLVRALAVALVAGAALAACGSGSGPAKPESVNGVYVGHRGGPRVTVAGDSITELSRSAIVAALEDRYEVRVDGFSGRTIAGVLPALAEQVATGPDVAVVNLGTNDMKEANRAVGPDVDRMLETVAGVPCVEVVTVNTAAHAPDGTPVGASINDRLRAAAAAGSVHLVDWNAAVAQDPALVVADGIHPNARGQRWIARAIRDAIATDC